MHSRIDGGFFARSGMGHGETTRPGPPIKERRSPAVRFLVPFLGVMLENVRFREQQRGQQMREQELLLLARRPNSRPCGPR